jgi:hypothetical protein
MFMTIYMKETSKTLIYDLKKKKKETQPDVVTHTHGITLQGREAESSSTAVPGEPKQKDSETSSHPTSRAGHGGAHCDPSYSGGRHRQTMV